MNDFDEYENLVTECNISNGYFTEDNQNYGVQVGFNEYTFYTARVDSNICSEDNFYINNILIYSNSLESTVRSSITMILENNSYVGLDFDTGFIYLNWTNADNITITFPDNTNSSFNYTYLQFIAYKNTDLDIVELTIFDFWNNETLQEKNLTLVVNDNFNININPVYGNFSFDFVFFLVDIPNFEWSTSFASVPIYGSGYTELTYYVTDDIYLSLEEYNSYTLEFNLPLCEDLKGTREEIIEDSHDYSVYRGLNVLKTVNYAICGSVNNVFGSVVSITGFQNPNFCDLLTYIVWFLSIALGIGAGIMIGLMVYRTDLIFGLSGILHITIMWMFWFMIDYLPLQIIISGIIGAIAVVNIILVFITGMKRDNNKMGDSD